MNIEEIINDLQRIADRKCYPEDILDGSIAQEWVDYITELQKRLDFMIDRNDEKQERIDKAIEYINEMCLANQVYADYGDDLRPQHLIDILKGSDKE